MTEPTGFTAVGMVGFTDQGTYSASASYVKNDLVHYGGSIWCCLIDDTMGIEPTDGVNWRLWVENSQNGISDIVNVLGAKNLLDVTPRLKAEPSVRNYLSYDGQTIIVNGTVSTAEYTRLNGVNGAFKLPQGSYIFSGTASSSDIRIIFRKNGTEIAYGQTPNVTFESDGDTDDFTFLVYIKAGTYTNETVKSMIRPSGIEDDTWQPYTKTNKELTEEVTQNSSDIQTLTNNVSANATNITNVAQKVSNSSDSYDSTKAYSVGDLCIYDNTLYRCITACSAASWSVNSSCFEETTLVETVNDMKDDWNYDISTTGVGTRSYSSHLLELFNAIDFTRVTRKTVLKMGNLVFVLTDYTSGSEVGLMSMIKATAYISNRFIRLSATPAYNNIQFSNAGGSFTFEDLTSNMVPSGYTIGIIY